MKKLFTIASCWLTLFTFQGLKAQTADFDLIDKADLSFAEADFAQNILDCDAALVEFPDTAFLYYYRGFSRSMLGEFQLAILDFDTAIQLEPAYAEPFAERAAAHYALGARDLAHKDIRAAIKRDPDLPEAYLLRAEMYLDEEMPEQAWTDIEQARRLLPKDPEVYCLRSEYYLLVGDAKSAIKEANLAIKLAPAEALGFVARAQAKSAAGELFAALDDIDAAISLAPLQYSLLSSRAMILDAMGDRKAAMKDLDRYISKDSAAWDAYLTKSWFAMQDSLWDESQVYLAKAKAIRPEELAIDDQWAWLLMAKGDFAPAVNMLAPLCEKMPNNVLARANLGYAKLMTSDVEGGMKDLEKAIKMDEFEPRSYFYRAEGWHLLKKPVKACDDLKKAEELGFLEIYGDLEMEAMRARVCD